MSTLFDARQRAVRMSAKDGCARHVAVSLRKGDGEYEVDSAGYYTSEWSDSNTVESYYNGKLIWER